MASAMGGAGTLFAICALGVATVATPVSRNIIISGTQFVDKTGATVLLSGPNVVVKGPPWLPDVSGYTACHDTSDVTCKTFNDKDAIHVKSNGWNFIRLGVTWAGAQPTSEPVLDSAFVSRLHAILDLCEKHGIHVLLDMHQDAVGTAVCGEGVPQWFSKLAVPKMIGKPLFPLSDDPEKDKAFCGATDYSSWALHAGEDNYNTKNPCCLKNNQGGWSRLFMTMQAQNTLAYLFGQTGRAYFATFAGLLAKAVSQKPAAIGIELMNEPPSLQRGNMYETWEAAYNAIKAEVPDMAVSVQDTGEAAMKMGNTDLSAHTVSWLKSAPHLFYAFHWYTEPDTAEEAVQNAMTLSQSWGMPALLTEFMSCSAQQAAIRHGIGWAYWHYSQYCDTAPSSQCKAGQACDFGACITGWGAGRENYACPGPSPGPAPPPPPPPSPIPPSPTPPSPSGSWIPCGRGSTACCDPTASPRQICPGASRLECQPCGARACECPSGTMVEHLVV